MPTALSRGLLAAALLALAGGATAADSKTGFVTREYKNADGSVSPYVVFVPHDYNGSKAYPVILLLHGAGETKAEKNKGKGKMPVEVGIGPAIKTQEKTFPAIVVIPRAEGFGWGADTENAKRALGMLDEVTKAYKTDPNRVYLTGLSMGGMGTWSNAVAHPGRWAAIVPICGPGDPAGVAKIKDIPCWGFVGDKDSPRIVTGMNDMIEGLKKAGAHPKYTVYPGVGHNSWDAAYATPELWTWLFEQKKK